MPKYHVDRSVEINALPDKVFEVVSDFNTWTTWSPWLCAEPDAKVTVSDDSSSVGSLYSWKGEVVGQGEIEHKKLEPGKRIEEEIRFLKPFKSISQVSFDIAAAGDGTKITWNMDGSLPFFLFFMKGMMEVFIGMDYERGLKMLKEWIETGQIHSKTTIRGVESVGPLRMVGIRKQCAVKDAGPSMEAAFAEACEKMTAAGLATDGEAMTVYHDFDVKAQTFDYTSGCSIPESADVPAKMSQWSLPKKEAFAVEHVGRYDHLGNAWSAAHQITRYKKIKTSKAGCYEIYKNDPKQTPPADLRTEIFLPLK